MFLKTTKVYEKNFFRTMGASLETSTKYTFSDLSQCCFPKWQASLFKTTPRCKTKKVTIKNNREVVTGALKNTFSEI